MLLKWSLRGGCAIDGVMAAVLAFVALGLGEIPGLAVPPAPYIGWVAVLLSTMAWIQLSAAYDPWSYGLNIAPIALARLATGAVVLHGADGCPGLTTWGLMSVVLGITTAIGWWRSRL